MQVPRFVHRTPHYQHGKPQSVHHVDLVQVQPPEQSIQDYDERIQVQRNTIANVRMTRHMSKIRYVHSEHRQKNTEGKRLKSFSSIHEYCWQIPCTNADCPRVFHTYSVWADPFFRDIPHLCERCAPRMSLNAKERVYSKEPSVNPSSDGVHHGRLPIATSARPVVSCGPVIHRMAFEEHVELVPQEVQGRRRKGVRKLTVALHSIEGKVPSPPSSPRPPSPMGHQGSRQREWPETDLNRQDATRDTQPEFFEHGLYVQLLSSQATPPTSANSEDAGYDLYSAADVTILPWSKELIPTDIAIMGPKGTYARIADRSGMALKHSLHVMGGVVDRPYRGNVQVILYNASQTPYHVEVGDKVSQFVLEQHLKPPISVVESLPATARGSAGFGSTGYRSTESMQHLLTHVQLQPGLNEGLGTPVGPNPVLTDPPTQVLHILQFIQLFSELHKIPVPMPDNLPYKSQLLEGDTHNVLPLLLVFAAVVAVTMADVVRQQSLPHSLGTNTHTSSRSSEAPIIPSQDIGSTQAHCEWTQLPEDQNSSQDRFSTTVEPPGSDQGPVEQWAPDEFQGNWGYARMPNTSAIQSVPCMVANMQELDIWSDPPVLQEARESRPLSDKVLKVKSHLMRSVQGSYLDNRSCHIKATAKQRKYRSKDTVLTVRQEIVDRIAAWTATIDPNHQDFCIQQDVFGSQKTARFTEHFEGGDKLFYRDWGQKPVLLHPSPHQWERCVTKLFVDGAKGIAVLPVSKKDPWFWAMGEVVIDWVDIPIGTPLFVSGRGKVVCTAVPYRICLFDAYGREPSHSKTHTQPTVNSDDDRTKDSQDMLPAMPSAGDLMSEVCSTSDSDSQDVDEPRGTGLNRGHRRLLRIMRRKTTEQQVSSDEGSPGPGNSSESEFESSSRHQSPTSIGHGCREVPGGKYMCHRKLHKNVAVRVPMSAVLGIISILYRRTDRLIRQSVRYWTAVPRYPYPFQYNSVAATSDRIFTTDV